MTNDTPGDVPMLTQVLERIAGRVHKRRTTARERIEEAARRIAAGETIDEAGVEGALFEAGLAVDDLGKLATLYQERFERKRVFDTLPTAVKREEAAQAKLAAEQAKIDELLAAFNKRATTIREELKAATRDVEAGRAARGWLLEVGNVPPSLRDDYAAALDREQAAKVTLERAEQSARALRQDILSEDKAILQLERDEEKILQPGGPLIARSQRERMSASTQRDIDDHERRIKRLKARLDEAEQLAKQSRQELDAATIALAACQDRILKAA